MARGSVAPTEAAGSSIHSPSQRVNVCVCVCILEEEGRDGEREEEGGGKGGWRGRQRETDTSRFPHAEISNELNALLKPHHYLANYETNRLVIATAFYQAHIFPNFLPISHPYTQYYTWRNWNDTDK